MDAQSVVGRLGRQWAGAGLASVRGSLPTLQALLIDFGVSLSNSQEQAGESHPEMLRGKDWQIPSHHSIPQVLLGVPRLDEAVEWLAQQESKPHGGNVDHSGKLAVLIIVRRSLLSVTANTAVFHQQR